MRSLFPRVFFTRTKYRWNRNKCWTELACYTPNARPTTKNIKIKGTKNMGEKKNFCSMLFCSAKSLLFFSTFDHLSSHFWCSCFFTGSSKFGGMVRSYLATRNNEILLVYEFLSSSKAYHDTFACVINTLWLATNIGAGFIPCFSLLLRCSSSRRVSFFRVSSEC